MNRSSVVWTAAWMLLAACQAFGHHSFASEFEAAKLITLRGTIAKVEWTNPHCHLWIDVRAETGAVAHWRVEMPPPNALYRRSIHRALLTPGDVVMATVFRARDGRTFARVHALVLKTGRILVMGSPGTRLPTQQ